LKKTRYIRDIRASILITASSVIGFVALSTVPRAAVMILAVPTLGTLANSRYSAFAVMLVYNLAASRGLLPGAAMFLSESHTPIQAGILYLLMSFGVSIPFLLFWAKDRRRKAICLPFAFLFAYVLPPISLIGIINPIMATGTVFKGWGFTGMLITLVIFAACAVSRKIALCFLCVTAAFTVFPDNAWYEPSSPEGFIAVDTSFGRLGSGSFDFSQDHERARMIFADLRKRGVTETEARYIVLPETIAGRLNSSGLELWQDKARSILEPDQILVFGAEIPTGDGRKYDNATIFVNHDTIEMTLQRVPVPYSMYRGPLAKTGANLHLFNSGVIALPDGRKTATVICYEAYLTWPYLASMIHRPDLIVSIANLWWCRNTLLPITQRTVISLWALTFGVPVTFARNI
jgi:apolipoprotein N-acyltransferase